MPEEKVINEEELNTNELLGMVVSPDSKLKTHLVEYVGTIFEKEEVTVNMIAETLAYEFPEFMVAIAEENFLRGYQLGIDDGVKLNTDKITENPTE